MGTDFGPYLQRVLKTWSTPGLAQALVLLRVLRFQFLQILTHRVMDLCRFPRLFTNYELDSQFSSL